MKFMSVKGLGVRAVVLDVGFGICQGLQSPQISRF